MTAQIWISTALQIFGTIVLGLFWLNHKPYGMMGCECNLSYWHQTA